jgi:rfaE bifunctional protein nucleotidyltransferase chain/domain
MIRDQILTIEQAEGRVRSLARQGRRVVLVFGCFDLLHPGHTRHLAAARKLGDYLLVAVNSDRSAHALKGEGRPILPALERAEIVAALEAVDGVTIFDDLSPAGLIVRLRPHIVAQASDDEPFGNTGAPPLETAGGQFVTLPVVPGYSTSALIRTAIKNLS